MAGVRHSALDERGDLDAAPGSRPWAVAVRLRMQTALRDERSTAEHLKRLMGLLAEHRGYAVLDDRFGAPFATLEAFCLAPSPFGLGYALDAINAIIAERKSAEAKAAEAVAIGPHRRPTTEEAKKGSPRTYKRGEASDYLAARIARDRPDVLERMKAGEFASVRAAAIAAGIVRPRVSVPADDVEAALRVLARHHGLGALLLAVDRLLAERETAADTDGP